MPKHAAPRCRARAAQVIAAAAALVLAAPVVANADTLSPAVTEVNAIDAHLARAASLGWQGVPDAAPGNNLEVPWFAYDEDGDLCGVRPFDNEWVTYTEFTYTGSDGVEWWKVVAVTNDGKPIESPVGAGLNVKDGWVTTTFAPDRAEFIIPQRKG